MRHGAGAGRTRDDHLDVAAQVLSAVARSRQVRDLADLIGATGLSATDRSYLAFEETFERRLLDQGRRETRSPGESLDRAWEALRLLPRRELSMLSPELARRPPRGVAVTAGGRLRRVPPGRAGRLWLAHRLGVASRAAELLDHKARVLRQEAERCELRVERTGEAWTRTCRDAETWSLRAALVGGQAALRAATDGGYATVTVPLETTMGVAHPGETLCRLPPPADTVAGPAAAAATRAYRQALVAAVEHAAALAAARAVEAELTATRQRLRAVTERWTPRLQDALAATVLGLEETERAEGVSLRWALRTARRGDGRR